MTTPPKEYNFDELFRTVVETNRQQILKKFVSDITIQAAQWRKGLPPITDGQCGNFAREVGLIVFAGANAPYDWSELADAIFKSLGVDKVED